MQKCIDLENLEFSAYIKPKDVVVWGQAQAEPLPLTQRLMSQRHSIGKFKVFLGISQNHTCQPEHTDCIDFVGYCGAGNKPLVLQHKLDILPCHYSQLPLMIENKQIGIDVVLIQVSAPDEKGRYSYSLAQDYIKSAIKNARVIIAEVNQQAPWVFSDDYLTEADFDVIVHTNRHIVVEESTAANSINQQIASHVASCIPEGATLQMGIGVLPEAILKAFHHHKNLGIHSGIISDAVAVLMQKGQVSVKDLFKVQEKPMNFNIQHDFRFHTAT